MKNGRASWIVNFLPEEGGRITGKLEVGDEEVVFRAMYDSSFKTIVGNIGIAVGAGIATGGHLTFLRHAGLDAEIVLPREAIAEVEAAKKGLMKRVVVTMKGGQRFPFEYGVLSVKKIVAAIRG